MEAALLGCFMFVACVVAAAFEYPHSTLHLAIPDGGTRRAWVACAMGATAAALIYSPWGQRSGAHFNPAVTLVFWRLRKVGNGDAAGYAVAQFAGGAGGVALAKALLGADVMGHPSVHYAVTAPGPAGVGVAFAVEIAMAFALMATVLRISSSPRTNRYTGGVVAVLVAVFVEVAGPVSGMSLNPARSAASALCAGDFGALWIYFLAPPAGMLLAAELYVFGRGSGRVPCAKLHHENGQPCPFHCRYGATGPS